MPTAIRFILFACTLAVALATVSRPLAAAEPRIVVAQNNAARITISVDEFVAENPADAKLARTITEAVVANLQGDGSFVFIDWWRGDVRPQARVTGRVARQDDSRVMIEVRLWEVASNRHISGQQFQSKPEDAPGVARLIVDHITQQLAGRRNP